MNRTTHTITIRNLSAVLAVAFALAVNAPAFAASRLAAGTTVTAVLSSSDINTQKAYVGQTFSMSVVQPYPNGDSSYAGAALYGHISSVVSAGQGRKAQLGLAFDKIVLLNGQTAHLTGHVIAASTKSQNTMVRTAAGALGGMIVGNYIGKHLGTNLGGLAGAAGGYLYASNIKANMNLARGAQVQLQLDHSVQPGLRQAGR
jgi:outer membrane lipoprotein SlyB